MKEKHTVSLTLVFLIAGALGILYILQGPPPLGYVTFSGGIDPGTTFTSTPQDLTCAASSNVSLTNASIFIPYNGSNITNTTILTGSSNSTDFQVDLPNGAYVYYCEVCDSLSCELSDPISFTVDTPDLTVYHEPVINLTFDDASNPWQDYSTRNHSFLPQGGASQSSSTFCKWYGCLNVSALSGDSLDTYNAKFSTEEGFALSYWIYLDSNPTGSSSQGYFVFGDDAHHILEGDYGANVQWYNESDDNVGANMGSSEKTVSQMWNHYFIQYNNTNFVTWKNGEIIRNESRSYSNINSFYGEEFVIGKAVYGIDTHGYLDEILVWNRGNFSNQEVVAFYDERREGTPAELDLVVDSITYELPYDFSQEGNPIIDEPLLVTITISNLGHEVAANNIEVELILEGSQECEETISLGVQSTQNITCILDLTVGQWYDGIVRIDSNNEIDESAYFGGSESNNEYVFYVPFESHPRLRFNQQEWDEVIYPTITNSSNSIPYNGYTWFRSFVSENFNPSWDAVDVDPRGKKGYENALNCYINDFNSPTACAYARNHLDGWLLQVDDWDSATVQAIHEIIHVGATYDLMFPNLTQSEVEQYSQGLAEACLAIYGKSNVQPHTDSSDPSPENGLGFGSGMAGACFAVLGDYINNPTLTWDDPQSTTPVNSVYYWNQRMIKYLQGLKNDSQAIYPEGMLYHWYSRYHVVDVLWFLKRTQITTTVQDFQPVICSFAKETAYNLLDHTYTGSSLRGDEGNSWRQVSYGDTNSFEGVGGGGVLGWDVITAYGLLCDDQEVKDVAKELRDLAYETNAQRGGPGAIYYYSLLAKEANDIDNIDERLDPFTFSSAFDRMTLRRGFTYENDSLFIFEGGDEANFGHPNAEFSIFSYVMGEPFLDFNQVPYNDDVRSEVWTNTISFSQSSVSGYNSNPRTAVLHQHYGGEEQVGSYPNFHYQPEGFRGDVQYALGTSDGTYATLHAYHPYTTTTSDPVRDMVIFDDLLIHVDKVHRTTSGPIYANWINIYDEFTPSLLGTNLTFQRAGTNKFYEVNGMWSSAGNISLSGGDSNKPYCFQKTSCNGGKGNYGKYYHEVDGPDAVTLFAHHWYEDERTENITFYDGTDKGIQTDNKTIIFDTNEDGMINESNYVADAYSLSYTTNVIAATAALSASKDNTTLFSSNKRGSFYIHTPTPGLVNATISLEEPASISLSLPGAASATLEINNENIHNSQFTVGNDVITFDLQSGLSEVFINQEGDAPPSISANAPTSNQQFFSDSTQLVSFSCLGTDDQLIESLAIETNRSGSFATLQSISPNSAGAVLSFDEIFSQGIFAWRCIVTDNASQSTSSSTNLFSVSPRPIIFPDISAFNGRTTDFNSLPSLDNLSGVALENVNEAFVNFTGTITSLDGVNLSDSIEIEPTYISVNTSTYPQLNVPACLEFYNVSYSTPRIKKNGVVFTEYTNYSYINGTMSFCVPGFSVYLIEETPTIPSEPEESGSSGGGGGGGSGGGSGGFGRGTTSAQNETENETVQVFEEPVPTQEVEELQETQPQEAQPQEETPKPLFQEQVIEETTDQSSSLLIGAIVLFVAIFISIGIIKKKQKKSHTAHLLDKYKFK